MFHIFKNKINKDVGKNLKQCKKETNKSTIFKIKNIYIITIKENIDLMPVSVEYSTIF